MANNYKVKMVDLQNKYKFKIFCSSQMYDDTELKRQLDTIYKAFPKASATGTSASLDGTAAAIMNIDLKGNGGKNFIDTSLLPITKSGLTISKDDNGNIVINGTPTISSGFETFRIGNGVSIPANTYTVSVKEKKVGIGFSIGGFSGALNLTLSDTVRTKTRTSDTNYYVQPDVNIRYDVGTLENFVLNPQLEIGSTATDYEPHGASVTGDNTIDICGKNLFDYEAGNINASGQETTSTYSIRSKGYINCTNNKTFNFSKSIAFENASGINGIVRYYDANKNFIGSVTPLLSSQTTGTTTLPNEAKYFRYVQSGNATYNCQGTDYQCMVEIGSTKTTYEPYQGANYPINLGSTKLKTDDSIQGSKNNWYIERADGTTEAITDATLITQLNNLRYNAESYEGTTNISQVNSDMPFIFTASAIKDLSNL